MRAFYVRLAPGPNAIFCGKLERAIWYAVTLKFANSSNTYHQVLTDGRRVIRRPRAIVL